MTYATEKIAEALKAARKQKGLSQRELSARVGVPQSHISKIENNGVDLRLSSLASIAHALDLELTLVPRKAVSAVKSIARSMNDAQRASRETRREMELLQSVIKNLSINKIQAPELNNLQRRFREIQQFQNVLKGTDALRNIRHALASIDATGGTRALKQAMSEMSTLRNALAHTNVSYGESEPSRPAYRLEEDDDG
jgi:transcriptional regulator with XRE-family HTH domain